MPRVGQQTEPELTTDRANHPKTVSAPFNATKPASVRTARIVLLCLLAINAVGANWRMYELLTRVRADARTEFFFVFVLYPAALALLEAFALVWLNTGRPAGRRLATLIFVYFAIRIGWLAWTGGGPDIETTRERVVVPLLEWVTAISMMALAAWVFLHGTKDDARRESRRSDR
jgi:hypothetical protein